MMFLKFITTTALCVFFCLKAQAVLHKPANYVDASGRQVVFVEFLSAVHKITYDVTAQKAFYISEIKFTSDTSGYPVFDAVTSPDRVRVDGVEVSQSEVVSPDSATSFRILGVAVPPGEHTLNVEGALSSLVAFGSQAVRSAFWTTDLKERNYLEKFLPSNLEYNPYGITLKVSVVGTRVPHQIFANGDVIENAPNLFTVTFPSTYTSSSHFYHLVPQAEVQTLNTIFSSMSGRQVPVIIYKLATDTTVSLDAYSKIVTDNLGELEKTYGPFAHSKMLVYATSTRVGMEYSGATMAMQTAVSHEVAHSWFARCALPANGNAGWLDEAVTVWRDRGYLTRTSFTGSVPMANHGIYNRHTDLNAYTFGADFIEFLNGGLNGLKPFLRNFFEFKKWQPYTTESFAADMTSFSAVDATRLFLDHVYNSAPNFIVDDGQMLDFNFNRPVSLPPENPMHPRMTEESLRKLL